MSTTSEQRFVARTAEALATAVSRRDVLNKGFRVAGGTLFMLFFGRSAAWSLSCPGSGCNCSPPHGDFCDNCPQIFGVGCPPGCTVCTIGQGEQCIYANGWWFGGCPFGNHAVCVDCKCGPDYDDTCGCCSLPAPPPPPWPDPCGPAISDTTTWIVDSNGEPTLSRDQLRFDLERYEGRPEVPIYMEEWALVSGQGSWPVVTRASTDAFMHRVTTSSRIRSSVERDEAVLVVEAPTHVHGNDQSHAPMLEPLSVQLRRRDDVEAGDFWFRAEVSATGTVDHVMLLGASDPLRQDALRDVVENNLRLRYTGVRRHRAIAFAKGGVTASGLVTVPQGVVIEPMCCCSDCIGANDNPLLLPCCSSCCLHPELQIWMCPCPWY